MNEMSQIGTATTEEMKALLTRQRAAQLAAGPPYAAERIDRINRVADLIIRHREAFEKALSDDFGHRSVGVTAFADIAASVAPLTHAAKNVRKWMKPEKRGVEFPLGLLGASARIEHQPKGVVGVMAPWNFPVYLALGPLAGVFAAGNRAMIKPSEFTPTTSELMRSTVAEAFDETELAVITGGPEVGAAFSALPFDHLMFTGATAIASDIRHKSTICRGKCPRCRLRLNTATKGDGCIVQWVLIGQITATRRWGWQACIAFRQGQRFGRNDRKFVRPSVVRRQNPNAPFVGASRHQKGQSKNNRSRHAHR